MIWGAVKAWSLAHKGVVGGVSAGTLLLVLLNRNRDVHPTVISRKRNEGHIRTDAGRYDHLFRSSGY